jgi:hypothetical protein
MSIPINVTILFKWILQNLPLINQGKMLNINNYAEKWEGIIEIYSMSNLEIQIIRITTKSLLRAIVNSQSIILINQ